MESNVQKDRTKESHEETSDKLKLRDLPQNEWLIFFKKCQGQEIQSQVEEQFHMKRN